MYIYMYMYMVEEILTVARSNAASIQTVPTRTWVRLAAVGSRKSDHTLASAPVKTNTR